MRRFLTRRQALQEAAVGFGAMAVNSMLQQDRLFAAEAASAKERRYDLLPKPPHFAAKAKRVIFIYVGGGPSTIDMFDPKPEAPDSIRGEFGVIRSVVPGTIVSEHIPLLAQRLDRRRQRRR